MKGIELIPAGLLLVLLGFVLIFAGVALQSLKAADGGAEVRGGGVVLIGPFPIVFGTDAEAVKGVLALTIGLIMVVYLLFRAR